MPWRREITCIHSAGNIVYPPPANEPLRHPANKLLDNLLKNYAGTSYRYDERGNMTERVRNGWRTVFEWDGFNRMTAATDQSGITTTFSYDALGRRLSKSSGDTTTLFGWDGDVLAFESTQSSLAIEEGGAHGWSVHYIHEPNSFVPLMQVRRASAMALSETTDAKALMEANGGVYDIEQDPLWNGEQRQVPPAFDRREMAFYQCDHLGTPQELTDHEGSVAWSAQYKAWGEAREAISEAGRRAGFRNPIRFQGQYWDEETGLHYNRYRYFDPRIGRFLSKDPVGLEGGINVYSYASNPVEWVDPTGLTRNPGGEGRKVKSEKPNQNSKKKCRKHWEVDRFDRVCDGHVRGVGHVKYLRDPSTGLWWSSDQTGHGGSTWKVHDKDGGWVADADIYGDYMSKHKGAAGKSIDFKEMNCKSVK
jgi:RHS repeat-associated protein